jgi:hypothetical protein
MLCHDEGSINIKIISFVKEAGQIRSWSNQQLFKSVADQISSREISS